MQSVRTQTKILSAMPILETESTYSYISDFLADELPLKSKIGTVSVSSNSDADDPQELVVDTSEFNPNEFEHLQDQDLLCASFTSDPSLYHFDEEGEAEAKIGVKEIMRHSETKRSERNDEDNHQFMSDVNADAGPGGAQTRAAVPGAVLIGEGSRRRSTVCDESRPFSKILRPCSSKTSTKTWTRRHTVNSEREDIKTFSSVRDFLADQSFLKSSGSTTSLSSSSDTILTTSIHLADDPEEVLIDISQIDLDEFESLRCQDPFLYASIASETRSCLMDAAEENEAEPVIGEEFKRISEIIKSARIHEGDDQLMSDADAGSGGVQFRPAVPGALLIGEGSKRRSTVCEAKSPFSIRRRSSLYTLADEDRPNPPNTEDLSNVKSSKPAPKTWTRRHTVTSDKGCIHGGLYGLSSSRPVVARRRRLSTEVSPTLIMSNFSAPLNKLPDSDESESDSDSDVDLLDFLKDM